MTTESTGAADPSPGTARPGEPPPPKITVAVTGAGVPPAGEPDAPDGSQPPDGSAANEYPDGGRRAQPIPLARRLRDLVGRDIVPLLSFVVLAFWVTSRLWRNPTHGLADNEMDQAQFEWMLAHGGRVVSELAYPFVSYQMNVPDGVNMMANTSVLAISIPLAPVTLLLGPHVAFNVFLTGALIATAVSWYLLLSRCLVTSRVAAWVGAVFCAFAPSMISHANGHPNIVSQFVIPLIIWRTLRLRESGRWLRNGLILGLLIVWQAFINLEILFMAAIGLGIFVAVAAILRADYRRYVRSYAAGLAVAGGFALCVLAYPLYVQFFGPQAYHGLPDHIRRYGADLGSFVAFSGESIAGTRQAAKALAQNPTEENAFFGWPLAILVVALVLWLRREVAVIGLAVAGVIFSVLSLGPEITFNGRDTGIPSLWRLVVELPLLNSVVPTRWALAITPIVGLLLAFGCEQASRLARQHPSAVGQIRFATATVLAMALIPIAPTTLPTRRLTPTPDFITSGAWRHYVDQGQSVVPLPLPAGTYPDPIRWSAETGQDMPIPHGYFLGPKGDPKNPGDRTATFSPPWRPTVRFFDAIRRTGKIPKVTPQRRADAIEDLRYWRAGVVILAPGEHADAFRRGMTELTGLRPTKVGGVWVWDVRAITG